MNFQVFARIADLPMSRLPELLPWEWKRHRQAENSPRHQAAWTSTPAAQLAIARASLARVAARMPTLSHHYMKTDFQSNSGTLSGIVPELQSIDCRRLQSSFSASKTY